MSIPARFSIYKFHFLLFILSFLILTKFNIDPDLGWHLAYGKHFLETGEIIRTDPFSWTMPGYEWSNSYFGYQILVAFLFEIFGHIGTGLVFGLIASLAIVLLLPQKLGIFKSIVVGLGVLVTLANLGIRPHTVSLLIFAALLLLLQRRLFLKGYSTFFWFFYFVVWANFHRGFVVGLLVMAVFMAVNFLTEDSKNSKNFFRFLPLVFAFLGTFINPFWASIWESAVFVDLTSKENLIWIAEWQPVGEIFPINLIFAATGGLFIYIFLKKFAKTNEQIWFLIAASIFMFSFVAAGFLMFWGAIFIFLATRNFEFRLNLKELWTKVPLLTSLFAVFVAFFLNFIVKFLEPFDLKSQLENDGYPVAAIEFLKENELKEGLFNSYEWGGYLDWQVPDVKVFIDGRMPSWRSWETGSIFADYVSIHKGNCQPLSKYEIKVVLVKQDFNTSCFIAWQLVYEDQVAKILVKP